MDGNKSNSKRYRRFFTLIMRASWHTWRRLSWSRVIDSYSTMSIHIFDSCCRIFSNGCRMCLSVLKCTQSNIFTHSTDLFVYFNKYTQPKHDCQLYFRSHISSSCKQRNPDKRLIFQQIKLNHLLFLFSVGFGALMRCVCVFLDHLMISKYRKLIFEPAIFEALLYDWDVCLSNGVHFLLCTLCCYHSFDTTKIDEHLWLHIVNSVTKHINDQLDTQLETEIHPHYWQWLIFNNDNKYCTFGWCWRIAAIFWNPKLALFQGKLNGVSYLFY